ncbi:hypothetical protein ACE6H2_002244 [Prunus campanulata]
MVESMRIRSKATATTQFEMSQSHTSRGPTTKTVALPHGSVAATSLPPHGLKVGSKAHHHDDAAVQDAATTHGHLGATSNYSPILEQLHLFPPLPLRLTIAPYTSNETLARVQLGSP